MNFLKFIPDVVGAIGGYLGKREDRKVAKLTINGKLKTAKQNNDHEVVLNRQEWESIGQIKQDTTWKDELVTVVVLWPLVQIMLGGLETTFFGTTKLIDGLNVSLKLLTLLDFDLGYLMGAVVLAAIGIKAIRR